MKYIFTAVFCLVSLAGLHAQKVIHTNVLFDFAKYNLKPDAKDSLLRLKEKIPANATAEVFVYGHTDAVGGGAYNIWLGRKRAESVKKYLEDMGIKTTVMAESYGKTKPAATNDTKIGRQKNRRVEVELQYVETIAQPDLEKIELAKIDTSHMTASSVSGKQTILTYSQGTILQITPETVAPYDIKDVKFDVREVLNAADMIKNHATTQDTDGNALISGGMVIINARVNGKDIEAAAPLTVNLPVEEYKIDKEMELFVSVKRGSALIWKPVKTPVTIVKKDDKYYYQFTVRSFGGYNCDKYRRSKYKKYIAPVAETKKLTYPPYLYAKDGLCNHKVRLRSSYYLIKDVYLYDKRGAQLVTATPVSKYRVDLKYQSTRKSNYRLYVSAYRGDQLYFMRVSAGALSPRPFSKTYILEKDMFHKVSEKQLDRLLAGL